MARRKLNLANNPLLAGPALSERAPSSGPYREVPVALIDRDPNQPRVNFNQEKLDELADSIRSYGVMNPLIVRVSKKSGRFDLIAGERRLRAAQKIGLKSVPVLVNEISQDESDEDVLAMQLVENMQRDDLTPLERAHAIGALKETHDLSIREVASKLGVSKGMVQRSLEILELPDDLLNALREGASESKILMLAKIEDTEIRSSYLKDLDALTRSELKKGIGKQLDDSKEAKDKVIPISPEDRRVVEEIQRSIGLKVRMYRSNPQAEGGRLTIEFYSNEDLQEIFRKLVNDSF